MAPPNPTEPKKVFSRQNIQEKQKLALEAYDKQVHELRQSFESVASTPAGEKVFKYLFLLCGGDQQSLRRNKERVIDVNETLTYLGTKGLWEMLRFNFTSDTIKKIERHDWEK